jgi:hypothetical protein
LGNRDHEISVRVLWRSELRRYAGKRGAARA